MNDSEKLINLLTAKTKLVCILAPSFPIVYKYPEIVSRLKALGFLYVLEAAVGAKKTNEGVLEALKNNPLARFITSPCPSFVRLIRSKHPHLLKYITLSIDSPMIAAVKIAKEKYPDCKPVFIGPCLVKKMEASEDYPELNLLVLTYKELDEVFRHYNIEVNPTNTAWFDIVEKSTRIYPMDGGLTKSAGIEQILKPEEILIVSGWKKCEEALLEFESNPKIRLLDILFCEGGCINGPGIVSNLSTEERKKKVWDFYNSSLL